LTSDKNGEWPPEHYLIFEQSWMPESVPESEPYDDDDDKSSTQKKGQGKGNNRSRYCMRRQLELKKTMIVGMVSG
jgi:hypothetical protein